MSEKKYWKGSEELHGDPVFVEKKHQEFPEELPVFYQKEELGLSASRRDFLKMLGFSLAGSALAACTRMPVEKAIPYLVKPEEVTPGVANWYASACAGCSASCGILAKTRDGRPIKIEGNPEATLFGGGLCAVGQASVLSLYDDQRLKGPLWQGQSVSWEKVDQEIKAKLAEAAKIVVLTHTLTSPATQSLLGEWKKQKNIEVVTYEEMSASALMEANEKDFGVRVVPHFRLEACDVVVGLNCDFLGTWLSPVEFASAYSKRRRAEEKSFLKHIQIETYLSLTGSNADERVIIKPSEESRVAFQILNELLSLARQSRLNAPASGVDAKQIQKIAHELWAHKGRCLVMSGSQNADTQSAVNAINSLLGNIGATVDLDNPSFQNQGDDRAVQKTLEGLEKGEVQALIFYGTNPVYSHPQSKRWVDALKKVTSVSLSDRLDETASLCTAVCPDRHFLESWNDSEPVAHHVLFQQPVVQPLRDARQAQDGFLVWMGRSESYYDYLRAFAKNQYFAKQSQFLSFDAFWDHSIQQGSVESTESGRQNYSYKNSLSENLENMKSKSLFLAPVEISFYQKIAVREGRNANNPWLQELPDPVSKVSWDNYACIAPGFAKKMGLEEGSVVRLNQVEIPVHIQPGQSSETIAVAVGYGRTHVGLAGNGVGVNVSGLRAVMSDALICDVGSVTLEKTNRHEDLACTQLHHSMEGRDIVREMSFVDMAKSASAQSVSGSAEKKEKLVTLWEEKEKEGHAWSMAVDLTNCIGCSACVIGCQAENNVPVVGKDEVRRQREMHWIRIDRYFEGSEENPKTVYQPMMCQHCGNAPCETVCPVLATVHSSDGLNQQVYNRCVGTRYCANNCPYKVRRFNWFDYAHNDAFNYNMNNSLGEMVLNPDIVVRSRGVMEKCSLCVQRIQEGKLAAKREGRVLKDGDIKLACEQSCPSQAIVFGDLKDPESRISKLQQKTRHYHVLEELNVQPIVGYLTKVRHVEPDKGSGGHS